MQNTPIFATEPDSVGIDELHLFLRIFDVLIRNLIYGLTDNTVIGDHQQTPYIIKL
jgi:hypothetical protein